jgi:hypothetical protein
MGCSDYPHSGLAGLEDTASASHGEPGAPVVHDNAAFLWKD